MSLQALIFDAAGTLIRVAEPVGQTYAAFAARHGLKTAPADVMRAFREVWSTLPPPLHPVGKLPQDDDRGWWRALVGNVFERVLGEPPAEDTMDSLFDELYRHYARPEAWKVFEDVPPALEDLRRDHKLVVLSNFDRRLRGILHGHGLSRFFEQIIISSEVGASKPHLRMFNAAIEALECKPSHCLHIGDDERCDLEGAQSCGMGAFLVKRPENGLASLVQKVRAGAYSGLRGPGL
ncbi:HAD-IA family hydrolase [Prosthecobacter sp.]|jgi:putative hydrolase of the HAD superfamily|uniref:HAD-IA family hydrolase n=1 Tax=Prosthecobacter sp. TaxID=1965333 RepID=UPI003784B073